MAPEISDAGDVLTINIISSTTSTPTGSQSIPHAGSAPSTPTLSPGENKFQLLGCYNELSSSTSGGALGEDPVLAEFVGSPEDLTVPLCLQVCNTARTPEGALGFTYAAVEDGSKCICGQTLSSLSTLTDNGLCSSPCAGDITTSCGGSGYLVLYELQQGFNNLIESEGATVTTSSSVTTAPPSIIAESSIATSSSFTTSTSTSTSPASSGNSTLPTDFPPSHTGNSSHTHIWLAVGVSLGSALLGLLLLLVVHCLAKRRSPRKRAASVIAEGANKHNKEEGHGVLETEARKFNTDLKRGDTIKGTVVRGKFRKDQEKAIPIVEEEEVVERPWLTQRRNTLDSWKTGSIPAEETAIGVGKKERGQTIRSDPTEEEGAAIPVAIREQSERFMDPGDGKSGKRSLWSETFLEKTPGQIGRAI